MFALLLTLVLAGNTDSSKVETDRMNEVELPKIEFVRPDLSRVSTITAPNEGVEVALTGTHKDAPMTELKEIPWETVLNICF